MTRAISNCVRGLPRYGRESIPSSPDTSDPATDLREQIDLDSMDMLNLMIAIHETAGVDIPEADYPQLATLSGCVSYLRTRIK